MRVALNRLYLWSGYISAAFLVAIVLTIVAQICGRFFSISIDSTESAGFSLAASTFFGLAYTYRTSTHIRVTLLTRTARGGIRRLLNIWAVAVFLAIAAYLTYWSFDLVYFSYVFSNISPGLLAVPFWIPRSFMALGALVLTIALADELICVLRGQPATFDEAEMEEQAGGRKGAEHREAF